MLQPGLDTGKSTGFGLFRGLPPQKINIGIVGVADNYQTGSDIFGENDDYDIKNVNVYFIGYARNQNFVSAIYNNVAGQVNTSEGKSNGRSLDEFFKDFGIFDAANDYDNNHKFTSWMRNQEKDGVIELVELRTENTGVGNLYKMLVDDNVGSGMRTFVLHDNAYHKTRLGSVFADAVSKGWNTNE